ncbi:unnamed protein product [Allacma fusca]|uniref:Glutathione S-transferase n=1 Tax=Allacma fusca TaxID=39272 RepID=A0A8J2P4A5_9HEXA|nr:unnamed protein product [Allacma fusca]
MAPQYKLTYFNARGLAEPVRLLLAHANIELEDVRVDGSGWAQIKSDSPWGKLPLLEEGGFKLSQSLAILKYLASKYGYVGETSQETARMDEYIGAIMDLREVIMSYHWEKDPEKKEEKGVKLEEETFPFYLAKFENILKKTETNPPG